MIFGEVHYETYWAPIVYLPEPLLPTEPWDPQELLVGLVGTVYDRKLYEAALEALRPPPAYRDGCA